jgi:xylono-1,5-lactonase
MSPLLRSSLRCRLGECPVWDAVGKRLLYLDLVEPHICELDVGRATERRRPLSLPPPLGGLVFRQTGEPSVFCRSGLFALDSAELTLGMRLAPPHDSFALAPPNDVAVHADGSVFVATADLAEKDATAGLFVVSGDGAIRRLASELIVGNGPALAPDGRTLYLADSRRGLIHAYDWHAPTQVLSNRRVFASVSTAAGFPDGMTVDAEGGVWSARWGGASVVRYAVDGTESFKIELPARFVTSCVFGGDNLRTLFITTAQAENAGDSDLGGYLFSVDVGVGGLPAACAAL